MKRIILTKGKFAQVSDKDFTYLNQWNWYAVRNRKNGIWYAVRRPRLPHNPDGRETFYMHREILEAPKNRDVDHKDGDGLNNQRSNIRIVTKTQNQHAFRRKRKKGTSKFRGVYWDKNRKKWQARTVANGKYFFLGRHSSEKAAAEAYNAFPHHVV